MENILKILKYENIRMVDGRYSNGFVDTGELQKLIDTGAVETYCKSGFNFVRLVRE